MNNKKLYKVTVPQGVHPNESFIISVNGKKVKIFCPPNVKAGEELIIELLNEGNDEKNDKEVKELYLDNKKDKKLYKVTVPEDVKLNTSFTAKVNGELVKLNCPYSLKSGEQLLFYY